MTVLMLVEILSSIEMTMVTTALPTIMRQFHGLTTAAWLNTAFLLVQAATAAIGGRLGDMFGRRRILVIVVVLAGLGSLLSLLGPNIGAIIAGRAIQGCSGAILPLCYGLTRETASRETAPFWIGVLTGGYAFAAFFGYILGGLFADSGHWRWIFLFTTVYSAALLPLTLAVVPNTPGSGAPAKFDVLGAALFAPAIAAILYGLTNGARWGWTSPETLALVLGGCATLAVWVWHEGRHPDPLIHIRLLRRREIALGNVAGALVSLSMTQLPVVSLLMFQQPVATGIGLGVTATMAGLLKLPSNLMSLAAAPLSGWISMKWNSRWAVLVGSVVGAGAWTLWLLFHQTLLQVVVWASLCGFANSILLAGLPNLVLEGAPLDRSSEVTGMTSVVRSIFAAVGSLAIPALLATSRVRPVASGPDFPSEAAYDLTFGAIAATALVIAILCLAVGSRRSRTLAAGVDQPAE
jgi:MFS family permease